MFLPTMTYKEIYQAISKEMSEVFGHYQKIVKPKVDRTLKTATIFPKRITIDWEHPKSRNIYTYYIQSNRRSQWANPFMCIFCEYEGKNGKELLIPMPIPGKRDLILQIFTSHFYSRYGERFLKGENDFKRIVALYMMRNGGAKSLGEDCVSINEQQVKTPGYANESMLTLDGLGLGLKSDDGNIVIFRTFVSFDQLFQHQFRKVWSIYLYFVCGLAMTSSPKDKIIINAIYEKGATRIHQITNESDLPEGEKRLQISREYEQTYQNLVKYIA